MEKLSYHVVHLSGQDENLTGKELEDQSPTAKGWLSSRFCLYPQEIVLSLPDSSRIRMIQVLSHQFLIATKIDVYLGAGSSDNPRSLSNATFKRLGYFCFKDNQSSNYKSRELKSVHVDGTGCFVKLLVHKNHINPHNLYNQVCLVAVNILGYHESEEKKMLLEKEKEIDDVGNSYLIQNDELNSDAVLKGRINRPDYISPLYDLAFDICQDPETAQLIRKLDHKKAKAVIEERYDYAKKLKAAIEDLKSVGEKLGKWEVEKRRAVEMEDYELAKIKKLQSDEYRLFIYKQLDLFDLLEINKEDPTRQKAAEEPFPFKIRGNGPKVIGGGQLSPINSPENRHKFTPAITSPTSAGFDENSLLDSPRHGSGSRTDQFSFENSNDKRILPVLNLHQLNASGGLTDLSDIPESNGDFDNSAAILEDCLPLSEKEQEEAGPIIDTFGMHLAKCVYSKVWQHRHAAAVSAISEMEKDVKTGLLFEADSKLILQGAIQFTTKLLKDQVFSIFNQSIHVTLAIFKTLIPKLKILRNEIAYVLDKLLPLFLHRCGDSSVRVRQSVIEFVYELAMVKETKVKHQICTILTGPFDIKGQIPWRLFKSRLEIIQKLLDSWDPNSIDCFDDGVLLEFLIKGGLKQSSKEVRDVAVECLLILYKKVGKKVKRYLPPDDASTRRNPLYTKIFDACDRIDGVPTEAERKAMEKMVREETERTNQKQISNLHLKIKALGMIAAEGGCKSINASSAQSSPRSVVNKKVKHIPEKDLNQEKIQDIEKICVFCGQYDDAFKGDQAIAKHYWRTCPMLRRCNHCPQVFEIAKTNHHFLNECAKKELFVRCSHCNATVLSSDSENHHKSERCLEVANAKPNCCPLCQGIVSDDENAWRLHLMEECKQNSIRLDQLKTQGELLKNSLSTGINLNNLNASIKHKKKILTPKHRQSKMGKKILK